MILAVMILVCVVIVLMVLNLIGEIRMQKRMETGLKHINRRVKRLEANDAEMAEEHDRASTDSDDD